MASIVDSVFWIKNQLFRRGATRQYDQAVQAMSMPDQELDALNWERRKAIVQHAYDNTPFYKQHWDSVGFHPQMLSTPADWEKVPVLEKQMVRQFAESMKDTTCKPGDFGTATTGGSTGMPLKVYTDRRFNWEALGWRSFKWWGVSPAAHVGIIHRRVPVSFLPKLKNRALWWPTRRIYLNASSQTPEAVARFASDINRKKIAWLQGYTGGLENLADHMLANGMRAETLRLIWSTAAPLHPLTRAKMERAFGCGIMNQYGCNEIPSIAVQCPLSSHLHINYDCVHVDVTGPAGECLMEQEGDILVTNLVGYAFPLIRYRLGDRGTLLREKCGCGCSLPLMEEVKGRVSDVVCTPSGIRLDGDYLNSIFDDSTEYIDRFRVHQKADYSVTVYAKVFKRDEATAALLESIRKTLELKAQGEIPVRVEIVETLGDDGGKIRYILSEIALAQK